LIGFRDNSRPRDITFGVGDIVNVTIFEAGGLVDLQADPASVFLCRGEARDVAEAMGIDCRSDQQASPAGSCKYK
jgi:hypothetical protein